MNTESFADVINEARDGRTVAYIWALMEKADRLSVPTYEAARTWFRGTCLPGVKHLHLLFDALNLDDTQRRRAIRAARRESAR